MFNTCKGEIVTAAFQKAMCSEGAQCFSAFIWNPNEAAGCRATPASRSDLEGVPNIYHHFSDVFSKGSTDSLPPHREYDLKIDIDETAKAPLGPVYPLSQSKLGALHEFIDEHLNMGFIRPSNSPFRTPVLFIKRRMVLFSYVSISDRSTPSLKRINIPFHLYWTY